MKLAIPERNLHLSGLIEEEVQLSGFRLHIVEQWLTDRSRITKTVCSQTGDPRNQLSCSVYEVNKDYPQWQRILQNYADNKAKAVDIQGITVYVTSLNAVSSLLNLLEVSDGDFGTHWSTCVKQVNLKRMACSGRQALTLIQPQQNQLERFCHIYSISEAQDTETCVCKLVKLCQIALTLLGLYKEQTDGFLCDSTRASLLKYVEIYGPFDVIVRESYLDQPLVASLLSKIVSLRVKMHQIGSYSNYATIKDVTKNMFGEEHVQFQLTVRQFQKWKKLNITGYLDTDTVQEIETVYAKLSPIGLRKARQLFAQSKASDQQGTLHKEQTNETQNMDEFIRVFGSSNDLFRAIWSVKKVAVSQQKSIGEPGKTDVLLEGSQIAENLIQNSRKLLKNVATKASKIPDLQREKMAIRGIKEGVVGSLNRFSNQVDQFKDRRLNKRRSTPLPGYSGVSERHQDTPRNTLNRQLDIHRASLSNISQYQLDAELPKLERSFTVPYIEKMNFDVQQPSDEQLLSLKSNEQAISVCIKALLSVQEDFVIEAQRLQKMYEDEYEVYKGYEGQIAQLQAQVDSAVAEIDRLEANSHKIKFQMNLLEDKLQEYKEVADAHKETVRQLTIQIDEGLGKISRYEPMAILRAIFSQ